MAETKMSKMTDALTYALAIGLAAGCVAFAGYKVVSLRMMENPPADLGLNFPPPKRKLITDDTILVDPISVQSITPAEDAGPPRPALQPYTNDAPVVSYKLLTVIDGVAFVEIATFRGREIRPVALGAKLPGAGAITRIERIGGRWILLAGAIKLVSGL
jgi:hypothetical protein